MASKAIMKNMIVPIEKKLPVETPDKIPENASIDDYEKIAYKMSMCSDEIIEKALDKLESRDSPKNSSVVEKKNSKTKTSKHSKKKDAKIEKKTESVVEDVKTIDIETDEDIKHQEELNRLTNEIDILKAELEKRKPSMIDESFRIEISKLSKKNDELLLKNSDLEFEVSRLSTENNSLKQKLEQISNTKRLPPQTYSQEGYTRNSTQICGQQVGVPPRLGMNGYESWN